MNDRTLAALFVLAVWWASTGIVLRLVWVGRSAPTLVIFSLLGVGACAGLFWSSGIETPGAAYAAFSCALVVWGWHELVFLQGIVTGPRKTGCPPDAGGWRRFGFATAAIIHHEVALAATLLLTLWLTWGRPNQVGTATFLVLWVMRLSAKLNVFLGVRNLTEQFVPEHLRYMLSYFRRARMNWLMPASLAIATAVAFRLGADSFSDEATAFTRVGSTLAGTLLALAVLEHVFLCLPLPDAMLWRWVIRSRQAGTKLQEL